MLALEQAKLLLESDFFLLPGARVDAEVVHDGFGMPEGRGMGIAREMITLPAESAFWLTLDFVDVSNPVALQEVLIRLLLCLLVRMRV
jgi:hypothetical protein